MCELCDSRGQLPMASGGGGDRCCHMPRDLREEPHSSQFNLKRDIYCIYWGDSHLPSAGSLHGLGSAGLTSGAWGSTLVSQAVARTQALGPRQLISKWSSRDSNRCLDPGMPAPQAAAGRRTATPGAQLDSESGSHLREPLLGALHLCERIPPQRCLALRGSGRG